MILLIDNYDSFSYNVYQLVGSVNPDIRVIRNDECSVDEIRAMNPSHIILSPGPGRPDKAGVCENVIRELKKKGLHLKAIRELMPKLVQATAEIKAFPAEAAETAKEKPDPAIPGKADEVPEVVVDLLPEREAEQLADTVMRQEEEERQTEFYRVLGRLLDQMIQKRRQEERSRRVDEAIRRHQQSRREAAATLEQKGKRTKAKRGHRNNG